MQTDYGKLFSIMRAEPEIQNYISPFLSAYLNNVKETLDNQISSLKIGIARLSSPTLYFIMSGDDFSLDINNPMHPKICCIGNSPQRAGIFGAAISLYITTINRLVNKKGMLKSSFVYDEFTSIYVHRINETLATARSNQVAITIAVQDASQLRLNYGKDQADVILNLPGNIIFGQVTGDSAKHLSDRIGKILQDRSSIQINRNDTSITQSRHLDLAIPASTISKLSAGEFVGIMADTPEKPIELKAFHGKIVQDNAALSRIQSQYKELPLIRKVSDPDVFNNYLQIKKDITDLVESEISRMMGTPGLSDMVVVKINA